MAVMEVERKVTKIGNSLGVTLPQKVLSHLDVGQGDEVKFVLNDDGSISVKKYKPLNLDVLTDIDPDFLEGLQDVFDQYDNTLRNLADR